MNFNNISCVRGDTISFGVEIEGVNTLDNAFFSVKRNLQDTDCKIQVSLDDGIYKVTNGRYGVRVPPSLTQTLEAGNYYYDFQIQVNLDVFTILIGKLEIIEEVTGGI